MQCNLFSRQPTCVARFSAPRSRGEFFRRSFSRRLYLRTDEWDKLCFIPGIRNPGHSGFYGAIYGRGKTRRFFGAKRDVARAWNLRAERDRDNKGPARSFEDTWRSWIYLRSTMQKFGRFREPPYVTLSTIWRLSRIMPERKPRTWIA